MRKFVLFFGMLLCSVMGGGVIAASVGLPAVIGGAVTGGASLLSPLFGIDGLRAGVYTEIWTGEMIKAFRTSVESIGWLNRIRSYDQFANNDVLHFVDIGGDPDVLINNTTYPIPVQIIADADKAIGLDKYQTKQTPITDDELYAMSYDKMSSMIERHRDSINEKKYVKALHALAPAGNTDKTPVILTTGANSADGTHKAITRKDIIALKKGFDKLRVPTGGRILVLCPDHVADLLENDQKFAEQYHNYTTGKISNLYGFEVYEYTDCPCYTVSSKSKLAFGSAADSATDRQASVAFYAPRMMKVTGSTKMYYSESKTDPANQQNMVNFRHYFICLPLKNEAIGAIVSALAAS
ncbi:MAG: hypothetical protein LBM08_03920 [Dysgonamonadaceae bacterium]|jgi:hypothetical protein|nr:hypothetical protein [Dysgonamonadaceae bacterium]